MLNLFKNIKDPRVLGEIDIYDFFDRIKNPDPITKKKIELARLFKSQNEIEDYQRLKAQTLCFTLNFSFNSRKTNATIKEATGLIYIDVDGNVDIDLNNPLIFASWLSLSGQGRGILVKVDNLTLENFKTTYFEIANQLNIEADNNAGKATQYCVHSYDENVYNNNDSIIYQAKEESIKPPNSVTYKKEKRKVATEIGNNNNINYNSLSSIDFKGKDYIFFEDEKEPFAKAWIPKIIPVGKRNEILFTIAYQFKALNPLLPDDKFRNFILNINSSRCIEPLTKKEVVSIVKKIEGNDNITPNLNNPRRIVFNSNCKLTANEKRAKTNKLNGKRRTKKTMLEIEDCLNNWDIETQGKVTQNKLAEATNRSIKTIERYYKEFEQLKNRINNS